MSPLGGLRSFTIREMKSSDVPAVAALHVATFNETHTVNNDGPRYALREHQWRAAFANSDSWFGVVIEKEDGELIGFAKGTPHDGGIPGFEGELNKIYLLRRYHRQGLGRALLCEVATRFLSRGVMSMLLFGEADNPSNRFYEAMGGERLFAAGGEFHGAYGWRDLRALASQCADRSLSVQQAGKPS
jgi:L-amino acid N-acyltransferase YncA